MAGLLKEAVEGIVHDLFRKKYSYIRKPIGLRAKITSVMEKEEYYIYSLKILDKNGNRDESCPEIPGIKSNKKMSKGDIVAVMRCYGDNADLYIIGKVIE